MPPPHRVIAAPDGSMLSDRTAPSGDRVAIVIAAAVHQRRELTLEWLRSVLAADAEGIDLHLVLLDDGSTDGTADAVLALVPSAEIITGDGSLYYASGTNLAIERALTRRPDYVLVANDDTVLAPDCLQRLVACARAHPRSIVGPLLVHRDDPDRVFQTYPRWHTRYGGWRHRHHLSAQAVPDAALEVDGIVGNCVLVPAAAIVEHGLLDDRGVHNWVGDAEWTPRLRRAGWQLLIEPSARVACAPNAVLASPWAGGIGGVRHALRDPLSPYNLGWLWANRTVSGPDPARGAAAFAIHVGRLGLKRLGAGHWPDWPDEAVPGPGARPLADDRFAGGGPTEPAIGGGATPNAPPIDLVLVWPYLTWGGAQTHLVGLSARLGTGFRTRALVPVGTDPHLITMLADHGIHVSTFGPPIDLRPARSATTKIARRVHDARSHLALWRATRAFDPATTVLHVDLAPWSSALLVRALARRLTVFQTLHTAPPALSPVRRLVWRSKLELVLAASAYHLTLGNADAGRGFDALLGRALGAALTPTAVDTDVVADALASLDRAGERARLGVAPGVPLVVGVGQLIERKGIDLLVDALAQRVGDPIAVRWIGMGADLDALTDRARRAGVGAHVQFVTADTFPTRTDLFRAIASADIYVQPSREEGLPLALVEAMALGVPVIATSVNGIPDVIEHEHTGLLIPPDDPAALAAAVDRLLGDPPMGRQLGTAGAARISPDHDMGAVATTLALLYRRALARSAAPA